MMHIFADTRTGENLLKCQTLSHFTLCCCPWSPREYILYIFLNRWKPKDCCGWSHLVILKINWLLKRYPNNFYRWFLKMVVDSPTWTSWTLKTAVDGSPWIIERVLWIIHHRHPKNCTGWSHLDILKIFLVSQELVKSFFKLKLFLSLFMIMIIFFFFF